MSDLIIFAGSYKICDRKKAYTNSPNADFLLTWRASLGYKTNRLINQMVT